MRYFTIILFLFPSIVCAQYLCIFTPLYGHDNVVNIFEKDCIKNHYKYNLSTQNDTLYVHIEGNETVNLKMTFNTAKKLCNYEESSFQCNTCSQKHIDDILKIGYYQWRKISDNKYLSNYFFRTEFSFEQKPTSDTCLIIKFKVIEKTRKDYRKYYKTLNQ